MSVYADGYGRWHALVPDTPTARGQAVDAIAREIAERETAPLSAIRQYVQENLVSVADPASAYGGYSHFAEYEIEA